jgi:hypothetical protein
LITALCHFQVLQQLQASGVKETIQISQLGYPVKMTYSEFIERYKVLLPYKVRKTVAPPSLISEQSQAVSKLQSSKPLQIISPNQRKGWRLSSKPCSAKKQYRIEASTRKAAKLIVFKALGVASTSSPLAALDKENNSKEYNSTDYIWTDNGIHFGQQRVLLQENQANHLEDCLMGKLILSALFVQQRWKFIKFRKYKRKLCSAIRIQRVFRAWRLQRHRDKQLNAVLAIQRHWRAWKLKKHEEFKQLSSETDGSSFWPPLIIHWSPDRGIASRHAILTVRIMSFLVCTLSADQRTRCRCNSQ